MADKYINCKLPRRSGEAGPSKASLFPLSFQQLEVNHGVYIFVINSAFLKDLPDMYHHTCIGAWMFTISLTLLIVPVEFFFRYLLVVQ